MTRLLVVDDKEESLYLLRVLLEGNGYQVDTARHGAEALLKARQAPPDLVISDLLMPIMDGFTLLRQWKADEGLKRIRFVVCTATYTEPSDERLALDLGADAFILKPVEPEDFIARLKEVLTQTEAAKLKDPRIPAVEEKVLLQEYSVVLVHKLEDKLMEAEEATRRAQRSEERLRLALDAGGMGMWDWDLVTGDVVWCENHARLFGLKPGEFDGRHETFRRLVHPDDLSELEAKVADARTQRVIYQHEYRIVWPDGSEHWIAGRGRCFSDDAGQPVRMRGVVKDISERKRTEADLRHSLVFLQTLIDAMPNPVFYKDASGRYLGCNRAFEQFFGASRQDIIGKTVYEVSPKELADRYAVADQELSLVPGTQTYEGIVESVDGVRHDVIFHKATFPNPDGTIGGLIGSIVDITERKRAEEDRAKLEAQLQQAQKMESIGRLAGGVAHDFNNALGPILGYAELLLADLAPGDPRYEELEQIRQSGMRARDLTRQLLAFSRKQLLTLMPVDLRGVLSGFEKLLRRTVREDIRIDLHLPSALGIVRADVGQIEQVLMNLVINAQDAMPEGGVLTLELADVVLDEAYVSEHQETVPGPYVVLTVSDTGLGMDQETLQYIFEPFFTTKELGRGTGLGLSMVYGIVKQHGGSIWVYSEPGMGTKFKIYLPQSGESAEQPMACAGLTPHAPRGIETILVVEDNEKMLQMTVQVLERQGYRVIASESALRCFEIVAAQAGPIDLLLTDVVMPGMNGRELYERLAAVQPGLKVLYMSGYTDDVIAQRGMLNHGVQFIQKPFSVQAFAQKVREVLDRSEPV